MIERIFILNLLEWWIPLSFWWNRKFILFLVESEFHHPINWWNRNSIILLVESEFHRPFNWWNRNSTIPGVMPPLNQTFCNKACCIFTVDGRGSDSSRIAGAFACGEKSVDNRMLSGLRIAGNTDS